MHALKLLHNLIRESCPFIHKKRLDVLMDCTDGAIAGRKLTLTGIGRHLPGKSPVKQTIQRVDRLLGNEHIHEERIGIYQALVTFILRHSQTPLITIDWSPMPDRNYQLLRAAVAYEGRSITLYEEVHPLKLLSNPNVQDKFLAQLSIMLPAGKRPIFIFDAGFGNTCFKRVESYGWHWIARIRNIQNYRALGRSTWHKTRELYATATNKPKAIGESILTKGNPLRCQLYLYKGKVQGRHAKNRDGSIARRTTSRRNAKAQREPWLLATSLPADKYHAQACVNIYKKRMQIEESFRDLKSQRFGFSFSEMRSKCIKRMEILLLIAALATLCLWVIAIAAKSKKLHYRYQANTVKNKNVLSLTYLGWQINLRRDITLSLTELRQALLAITENIAQFEYLARSVD